MTFSHSCIAVRRYYMKIVGSNSQIWFSFTVMSKGIFILIRTKCWNLKTCWTKKLKYFNSHQKNPVETYQFLYTDKSYCIKILYSISYLKYKVLNFYNFCIEKATLTYSEVLQYQQFLPCKTVPSKKKPKILTRIRVASTLLTVFLN